MKQDLGERIRQNATGIAALTVTGTWLAALVAGQSWWLPFMLFGYIVVVPIVAIISGDRDAIDEWWGEDEKRDERDGTEKKSSTAREDPLETLRSRYARGELTDAEFETKLDRLLETETLEAVVERRERESSTAAVETETE